MIGNNNMMSLLPLLMGMNKNNSQQGMNMVDMFARMQGGGNINPQGSGNMGGMGNMGNMGNMGGMGNMGNMGGMDNNMMSMMNIINMMNQNNQNRKNNSTPPLFNAVSSMLPADMVKALTEMLNNNTSRS